MPTEGDVSGTGGATGGGGGSGGGGEEHLWDTKCKVQNTKYDIMRYDNDDVDDNNVWKQIEEIHQVRYEMR